MPEIAPFELYPITNTLERSFSSFWPCKIPRAEIRKFFTGLRMQTPIHMSFLKCSKSVQDRWPKVRIVFVTEKEENTFWHP